MSPREILDRAGELGLHLEAKGNELLVYGKHCPQDFKDLLIKHKPALLEWLKGSNEHWNSQPQPLDLPAVFFTTYPPGTTPKPEATKTPDPWIHVGVQVLQGEFDNADNSTAEAITIGLRSNQHPTCRAALTRPVCRAALARLTPRKEQP